MADAEISSVIERDTLRPRRIGRYEVCFELASGGMATVYLARLDGVGGFSKLVALKCIHPHLVNQEGFVEMFLDEARLASRVDHPSICAVFDFGFGDDRYYIAMECLVGETVARLARLGSQRPHLSPMPEHAYFVARIIAQAAEGLHAAHELRGDDGRFLNVVHRDVSPQNLMVTYDGAVKVMDFGIASAVDQLHLTRTGTVRGKFGYMSPEQLNGALIDRRSDVWSSGVVLWELLTGKPLFGGMSEAGAMRAVLEAPIAAPSSVRSGIPKELDDIALRCLARDPTARYPTAAALAEALNALRPRRGPVVTAAMLGMWLRTLFPDLYARRMELVDQARQTMNGVPRVSAMLSQPDVETQRMSEFTSGHAQRRRGLWPMLIGGSVALAALVFGLVVAQSAQQDDSEAVAPAEPAKSPELAKPPPSRDVVARTPVAKPESSAAVAAAPAAAPQPDSKRPVPKEIAATGFVDVATPGGWADVYSGSRHYGRTPLRLTLPSGARRITLRPFGKGPAQVKFVTVRPGKTSRLVAAIKR